MFERLEGGESAINLPNLDTMRSTFIAGSKVTNLTFPQVPRRTRTTVAPQSSACSTASSLASLRSQFTLRSRWLGHKKETKIINFIFVDQLINLKSSRARQNRRCFVGIFGPLSWHQSRTFWPQSPGVPSPGTYIFGIQSGPDVLLGSWISPGPAKRGAAALW